jgi:FMN phosphatase YigB (HAD superfamily)
MKTIVFDFGNVIGFFDYHQALARLQPHTELSAEQLLVIFGGQLQDDYESGRITSADFLRTAKERCGFRCTTDEFSAAYVDIFWQNDAVCTLLPRLAERYKLLLGSNTCDLHAIQFRRQFADALAHFDALVLSHEIGVRKPQARFFEHAQSLAGCAAHECLFIDDLHANVEGARACGWKGIVYRKDDDLPTLLREYGIAI